MTSFSCGPRLAGVRDKIVTVRLVHFLPRIPRIPRFILLGSFASLAGHENQSYLPSNLSASWPSGADTAMATEGNRGIRGIRGKHSRSANPGGDWPALGQPHFIAVAFSSRVWTLWQHEPATGLSIWVGPCLTVFRWKRDSLRWNWNEAAIPEWFDQLLGGAKLSVQEWRACGGRRPGAPDPDCAIGAARFIPSLG